MRVLIRGTGTIGKPLIKTCLALQEMGVVEEVMFHKWSPYWATLGAIEDFMSCGAKLVVDADRMADFKKLLKPHRLKPSYTFEQAVGRADVIIDCTDKGQARKAKEALYQHVIGRKLFVAQGSEKGFGKPFAFNINDLALVPEEDRFLQVVSCNTHQILCVLKTVALDPENSGSFNVGNLVKARFYLGRRGADISQGELPIGPEVGGGSHPVFGSHQAEDAARVLQTVGVPALDIHSAADTLNNPYMHLFHFEITLGERVTVPEVVRRFSQNPLVAVTYETSSNKMFSEGRDRGFFGRIFNQTIVCLPNPDNEKAGSPLEVISDGHEVIGRCLTPQDGNSLLTSLASILWFQNPDNYQDEMRNLFYKRPYLFGIV